MKILLLGENGSLGQQFKILFKSKKINFIGTSRKKLNLKFNYKNLKSIIYRTKPDIIINCIALTGLIYCEDKPQIAYQVNTKIPLNILKIIKNTEIKLIHFSSEAVFRGKTLNKLYSEKNKPNPRSIYGITKLNADKKIISSENGLVIRLPVLFGPTHKNQVVSKLLTKLINKETIYTSKDVYSTPVYTPTLCDFVYKNFIRKKNYFDKKLIHFTSNKKVSIFELILKLSKNIKKIDIDQIVPVNDSYFKSKIDIKPKNLGLTSIFSDCITKIDYKKISNLI